MVYFNSVTAKARTRGALVVCRIVLLISSSFALDSGSAREASTPAGSRGSSVDETFLRFAGDSLEM